MLLLFLKIIVIFARYPLKYSNTGKFRLCLPILVIKRLKHNNMEGLIIILGGAGFVALIYNIWISTKAGKKWLANL